MGTTQRNIPPYFEEFYKYNIDILTPACLKCISKYLNEEVPGLSECYFVKDWTGLAESIGYDASDIRQFASRPNPTGAVLEAWSQGSSTVERLLQHIHDIGRFDLLESEVFRHTLEKGVGNYEKRKLARLAKPKGKQDNIVPSSLPERKAPLRPRTDELDTIVVGDMKQKQYFDAFVCYTSEDKAFVFELVRELEDRRGLRLCINARDLLGGVAKYVVTAELIEKRCKRMLVIQSSNFMKDGSTDRPECDFQIRFAQSLSPGSRQMVILPIFLDPCKPLPILKHVTPLHYYRTTMKDWFWDRVAVALRAKMEAVNYDDYEAFKSLSLKLPPSETVSRDELSKPRLLHPETTSGHLCDLPSSSGHIGNQGCTTGSATSSSTRTGVSKASNEQEVGRRNGSRQASPKTFISCQKSVKPGGSESKSSKERMAKLTTFFTGLTKNSKDKTSKCSSSKK